ESAIDGIDRRIAVDSDRGSRQAAEGGIQSVDRVEAVRRRGGIVVDHYHRLIAGGEGLTHGRSRRVDGAVDITPAAGDRACCRPTDPNVADATALHGATARGVSRAVGDVERNVGAVSLKKHGVARGTPKSKSRHLSVFERLNMESLTLGPPGGRTAK